MFARSQRSGECTQNVLKLLRSMFGNAADNDFDVEMRARGAFRLSIMAV